MVVPSYDVGFIYILGKLVLCFLSLCSLVICTNNRVRYGPMVVVISLHITLPHYHHYADVSESIELLKYLYILPRVYLNLSQFSQSTLLWWLWEYVYFILLSSSNRKYEPFRIKKQWFALYVFLCSYNDTMTWEHFRHHPPFVERIRQLSVDTHNAPTVSGALGLPLLSSSRSTWTSSRLAGDMICAHQTSLWCDR